MTILLSNIHQVVRSWLGVRSYMVRYCSTGAWISYWENSDNATIERNRTCSLPLANWTVSNNRQGFFDVKWYMEMWPLTRRSAQAWGIRLNIRLHYALPRKLKVAAALNRLQSLRIEFKDCRFDQTPTHWESAQRKSCSFFLTKLHFLCNNNNGLLEILCQFLAQNFTSDPGTNPAHAWCTRGQNRRGRHKRRAELCSHTVDQ